MVELDPQPAPRLGPDFIGKFSFGEWLAIVSAWVVLFIGAGFIIFAVESMAERLWEVLFQ